MINPTRVAKALADPLRYKILMMLARQEQNGCCAAPGGDDRPGLCNCELMAELGLIQSRVSYHMKELVEAGLVTEEPRGKWKMYYLNNKTVHEFCERLQQDLDVK